VGLPAGSARPATRSLSREQWRVVLFCAVLALYAALTLAVVFKTSLLSLDTHLAHMHFRRRFPGWRPVVYYYVMLGQRGPATLLFLPYFLWTAWRRRSTTPIVMLVTALVLLNVSVGVVKYAIGRLGPRAHEHGHVLVSAHDLFAGGTIYPSGHVSNAVVLYGLIVMVAMRYRKLLAAIAVLLSITIGLGTVFLDTHWFSDVMGGWLAGALVLISLPWVMPTTQRWADAGMARLRAWWRRRQASRRATVPVREPLAPRSHAAASSRDGAQQTQTQVRPAAKLHLGR
jgi:membrane-associated phospholipid phosphatase